MAKYIWQQKSWPKFTWDLERLIGPLSEAKKAQGNILGQAKHLKLREQAELFVEEAMATSAIEGEKLDREGVRSSVARRLGLSTAGMKETPRNGDGVVQVLVDATTNHTSQLTQEKLWGWHSVLFPTGYSNMEKIVVADWRQGHEPMRVVSKKGIHFEAPAARTLDKEMAKFLKWWNTPDSDLDGILRAAIAHFWFVTIHPFDDGNGRLARALTDMALAQDEKTSMRLYSLSSQIVADRDRYYQVLEATQKGEGDITEWIIWFLELLTASIAKSAVLIERVMYVGDFFSTHGDLELSERQKKVLRKMLELWPGEFVGGLTNTKYVSMTGVSSETAKRDIKDLVEKKILLPNEARGRSTSYRINPKSPSV